MSNSKEAKRPVEQAGRTGETALVESEGSEKKRGPLAWALGWLGIPGMVLGGIFAGGVLIGANFHDSWVTRAFVWVGDLF